MLELGSSRKRYQNEDAKIINNAEWLDKLIIMGI